MNQTEEHGNPFDRESTLLPAQMPSLAARGTGWVLVLLFVCAVLGAVIVRVPETVRCGFLLVPQQQADPIQSPLAGEVDRVLVAQGQSVKQGAALFHIRSQDIRGWRGELEQELADQRRQRERLAALPREERAERLGDAAALAKLQQQLEAKQQERVQLRKQHQLAAAAHVEELKINREKIKLYARRTTNREEYLRTVTDYVKKSEQLDRSLISASELMKRRLEQSNAALELVRAQQDETLEQLKIRQLEADRAKAVGQEKIALAQLAAEIAQIKASLTKQRLDAEGRALKWSDQRGELQSKLEKSALRVAALEQKLTDTDRDQIRIIRAPYEGTILAIARKTPGDVVARGAELCQIARSDSPIRAELVVSEQGLPRLHKGQPVKLLFEAFPHQRYGVRRGKLALVLRAPVVRENQPVYLAYAELEQHYILIEGDRSPLRVGMKGESRILVGRRALVEYIFEPLRQLRESVSDVRLGGGGGR